MTKKKPTVVSRVRAAGPWKNDAHLYVDEIEMSDGTTTFGCTQCKALSPTAAGISRHVAGQHIVSNALVADPPPAPVVVPDITVGQVIKALINVIEPLGDLTLDEFADAFNDGEEWRERALTAEAELGKIKAVLGWNHTTAGS
jgi:hypothetical protein